MSKSNGQVWPSDHAQAKLGRYIATEHEHGSVATLRLSSGQAQSLRRDRARAHLDRYVATKFSQTSIQHESMHSRLLFNDISRRPRFNHSLFLIDRSHQSNFTIKTTGSFFIEETIINGLSRKTAQRDLKRDSKPTYDFLTKSP